MKMRRMAAIIVAICLICAFILASCGSNYESVVKKQFISDCETIGSGTLQDLGTQDKNSVVPLDESDVIVTTVTEGEKYQAEGDLTIRNAHGELGVRCIGTYEIDENGNAQCVDWDVDL